MKNILYISVLNLDKESGVNKKIFGQIKAFSKIGAKVSFVAIKDGNINYFKDDKTTYIRKSSDNKIFRQMQMLKANMKIIKEANDVDLIYIRYSFTTPQMIKLLKTAKKKNIKVVEEIPTYPYDDEFKNSKRLELKLAWMVDKHYRKKLKKYLCKFVTCSEDDQIFGIETIKIQNGVDIDNIHTLDIKYNDKKIEMIVVSAIEYWQGYDRLIKSLREYYNNKKNEDPDVIMHIVGDGAELENLKKLVEDLQLKQYIEFYGFLSGKELEDVYNKCQCAIAGLGIFRKNLKNVKTLKVREYIARAIPFVYSTPDESIKEFKYAYKVSDDEEIFDMNLIIEFIKNLDKKLIKEEMRSFAEEHYRWEQQMSRVLEGVFLNGGNDVDKYKKVLE